MKQDKVILDEKRAKQIMIVGNCFRELTDLCQQYGFEAGVKWALFKVVCEHLEDRDGGSSEDEEDDCI